MSANEIQEKVRQRYAEAATSVDSSCCGSDCSETGTADAFATSDPEKFGTSLYEADDLAAIPDGAALASLGCGNPTAVAELLPGETVLDLGSGAGIDVLLSAKRVGPTGFAYGIDMTDEMLALARKHQAEAGATNVEFRKGYAEELPAEDEAVDVVISNGVINLCPDKMAVMKEVHRVLKPGARFQIADIIVHKEVPQDAKDDIELWSG